MELFTIWHEQEHGTADASQGFVNPAAMEAWAADSIEARAEREEMNEGAFE